MRRQGGAKLGAVDPDCAECGGLGFVERAGGSFAPCACRDPLRKSRSAVDELEAIARRLEVLDEPKGAT